MFRKYLYLTVFILMMVFPAGFAGQEKPPEKVDWHAYTQLRFSTNLKNNYNFSVRRLKFWLHSGPDFSKHWSFKAQAIFMSISKEKFFLQDIYGQYRWKNSSICFGQFIPQYSLQRFQPDFLLPNMERARAVNLLIPDGTLGVRDIGVQYNLFAMEKKLQFNIGLFNGYGIKDYRFNNAGMMITQNFSYLIPIKNASLKFGFSLMYRKAQNLYLPFVFSDTLNFTGNDFRFNINGIFSSKIFDVQAEYLQANLDGAVAKGYYVISTIRFNEKNHAYFMYDHYTNAYDSERNNPWYVAGYNYLFKSTDIMLSLETGFTKSGQEWNNRTVLQFQIFFH